MPQPFNDQHAVWDEQLLLKRPALAAHIATIAALWTRVDANIGHILGAMCGSQAPIAVAMYAALVAVGPRTEALNALAKFRLSKKQQEKLRALLKEYRERSKERNAVVHGIWGVSARSDKYLLHQDAGAHTLLSAGMLFGRRLQTGPAAIGDSRVMRYVESDFVAIEGRISKLKDDAWTLCQEIHKPRSRRRISALTKRRQSRAALTVLQNILQMQEPSGSNS